MCSVCWYYVGNCTCLSFEPATRHCMASFRPSKRFAGSPNSTHVVSHKRTTSFEHSTIPSSPFSSLFYNYTYMYIYFPYPSPTTSPPSLPTSSPVPPSPSLHSQLCQLCNVPSDKPFSCRPIHQFMGGTSHRLLSRSRLFQRPGGNDSRILAAFGIEENKSVRLKKFSWGAGLAEIVQLGLMGKKFKPMKFSCHSTSGHEKTPVIPSYCSKYTAAYIFTVTGSYLECVDHDQTTDAHSTSGSCTGHHPILLWGAGPPSCSLRDHCVSVSLATAAATLILPCMTHILVTVYKFKLLIL